MCHMWSTSDSRYQCAAVTSCRLLRPPTNYLEVPLKGYLEKDKMALQDLDVLTLHPTEELLDKVT